MEAGFRESVRQLLTLVNIEAGDARGVCKNAGQGRPAQMA